MSDELNEGDEVLSDLQKKKHNFSCSHSFLFQTGANSALKAKVHFPQVMNYQVFTEAESCGVNLNSEGSVHPVQGSLQWNSPSRSHIKGLPEISTGLDRGWEIHDGNHSLLRLCTWRRGGKTLKTSRLLFHIFSLYYYKTLHGQFLISTLSTVEHRGTERQKIKSISHPKGINNIKDKLFSFKTDTFIWNSILLLQKINKSSKEFLIF